MRGITSRALLAFGMSALSALAFLVVALVEQTDIVPFAITTAAVIVVSGAVACPWPWPSWRTKAPVPCVQYSVTALRQASSGMSFTVSVRCLCPASVLA